MRKSTFIIVALASALLYGCSSIGNSSALVSAGQKAAQAAMITDDYIRQYVGQYIQELDAQSTIAGANDPYAVRLKRLTKAFEGDGFNFKVYKTDDVNAFAVADGSIRVYSGLMDIMSDEELLGVIGHEIGHVHNTDTKDAFKRALITSALRDGVTSLGGTVGALSQSQLGDLGEALSQSQYSQKQEYEADDYGYEFLKKHGMNPLAMPMSLGKLRQMEESAGGAKTSGMMQLFSTHPQIEKRMERLTKKAEKEGYTQQ